METLAGSGPPPTPPAGYAGPDIEFKDHQGNTVAEISHTGHSTTLSFGGRRIELRSRVAIVEALDELKTTQPFVQERPWATSLSHANTLISLATMWPSIGTNDAVNTEWHITVAYAVPIRLDGRWISLDDSVVANVVFGEQLVAMEANQFNCVRANFNSRHHRRLLRRANFVSHQIFDADPGEVRRFLQRWSEYSAHRFGVSLTERQLIAVEMCYRQTSVQIMTLSVNGKVIAETLLGYLAPVRTTFDYLCIWRSDHSNLRPGILAGVLAMKFAAQNGMYYSLGYGNSPYKSEILGESSRIILEDIYKESGCA